MAELLALLRGDPRTDARTRAYADAVAALLEVDPRVLQREPARTEEQLRETVAEHEVRGLVLPVGPDPEHDTWPLARTTSKPVIMLGRRVPAVPGHMSVGMVPLDGARRTSAAIIDILSDLRRGGMRLHAVHVFDRRTVPAFWDAAHSEEPWVTEFVRRHLDQETELDLRQGIPAHELFAVQESGRFDLVVLGWQQSLREGRAAIVRRCVLDGSVPVLLVGADGGQRPPGPSALVQGDPRGGDSTS
jgi:hypothetical protein